MSSYRDELRLTEYLLERLEIRLAGREEPVCMDETPSDRYHLGVLVPRRDVLTGADYDQPDEIEEEGEGLTAPPQIEETGYYIPPARSRGQERSSTREPVAEDEPDGESPSDVETEIEERILKHDLLTHRGAPAALGMDFKVVSDSAEAIEVEFDVRFAIYTRHFPTFKEQREYAGSLAQMGPQASGQGQGKAPHSPQRQPRHSHRDSSLPIRDKYLRHEVEVCGIRLRLPLQRRSRVRVVDPFRQQIERALVEVRRDRSVWRTLTTRHKTIPASALGSLETYLRYLADNTGDPELPPFSAVLDVRSAPTADYGLRVSVFVVNATEPADTNIENAVRCLVDVQLEARLLSGQLAPVELIATPEDYQYDRRVWAVGHAVSVDADPKQNALKTQALARYGQPRLATNNTPPATFEDLSDRPLPVLNGILHAMQSFAEDWENKLRGGELKVELTDEQVEFCRLDLNHFRREIECFQAGIVALQADERLLEAFKAMNRVFVRVGARKDFDRWYLFQICFIVTQLPSLAVRERCIDSDILEWTDVLWFPTGGGKTEAYLGLIVCAALYDRLRGKHRGVTAWLRFPLRMLSVQQLHRAAHVLWEAEEERLRMPGCRPDESDPISLGYFVGRNSTPNSLDNLPNNPWRLKDMASSPALREKVQVISDCPKCQGEQTIEVLIDTERHRIRHVCRRCHMELPIYVSDEEIYRFSPTVIVGTVDKIATLSHQARFSSLWGGITWRCPEPEHGYSFGEYCTIFGCKPSKCQRIPVTVYDPAPALHIQDELHLLREELGAFTGHYETLVRYCEEQIGGLPPKALAATATVEGVDHQARHLYGLPARRFPERGYDRWESFYTTLDRDSRQQPKVMRHYVAFRSHYMNSTEASLICLEALHKEIRRLYADPVTAVVVVGFQDATTAEQVLDLLNFYDTTLTYVGVKAAGTRIEKVLHEEIGRGLPRAGSRDLEADFLSGQSSLREIHGTVVRLENPPVWNDIDRLDALVATSLISHGVDVERLNLMVMNGMPGRTAEYIQASSRSGRRHVGLVIVVLSPWSIRDQSVFHRFVEHHRNLERLVTPVPINRFAKFIVERTMPGVIAGLIMGHYVPQYELQQLKKVYLVNRALDGVSPFNGEQRLTQEQLFRAVIDAYALEQGRYNESLELAMKEEIDKQFRRQLRSLRTTDQKYLVRAFTRNPMFSLRDVDRPVIFGPDHNLVGWEQLRWLDRRSLD